MNKRFNLQDFLDQKLAVYCSTEENSLDFLQYLEDNTNIKWSGGDNPTGFFLEKVCYSLDDRDLVWGLLEDEDLTIIHWIKEERKGEVSMKYKIGDKVRIKYTLRATAKTGIKIENCFVDEDMEKMAGQVRVIKTIVEGYDGTYYQLESCDWNWTQGMFDPVVENEDTKEIEPKKQEEQKERIISFEDIEDQKDCLGFLEDDSEEELIQTIKNNISGLLTLYDCDIKYKDIPSVISWLQDIYTYGQQQLKKVEYVDFQTALAWMKENEDNEAKFGNNIFSYTYGNLWIRDEERNHITTLTLPMVESKEWIIIKED